MYETGQSYANSSGNRYTDFGATNIYRNVDQTHLKKKCVWFQTERKKKSQNYILFVYMQKFLVRTFYKLTVSFD